jgi:hypothetical protein
VWVPLAGRADLIELNFLGLDPAIVDPVDSYEKDNRSRAPGRDAAIFSNHERDALGPATRHVGERQRVRVAASRSIPTASRTASP